MRHLSHILAGTSGTKFLLTFFAFAFGFSWLVWLPAVLISRGFVPVQFPVIVLAAVGSFGPLVAACLISTMEDGREGLIALARRGFNFDIPWRWLLFVLAMPFFIAGAAFYLSRFTGAADASPHWFSSPSDLAATFVLGMLLGGPLGEELGWRGFALDRLQLRYNARRSSFVLGTIWGLWHLPLFMIVGLSQSYVPFWAFLIFTVSLSFLFTLVYNQTGRSVPAVLILHTMVNLALAVFPLFEWTLGANQFSFLVYTSLYVIAACLVTFAWGSGRLARQVPDASATAILSRAPASE